MAGMGKGSDFLNKPAQNPRYLDLGDAPKIQCRSSIQPGLLLVGSLEASLYWSLCHVLFHQPRSRASCPWPAGL